MKEATNPGGGFSGRRMNPNEPGRYSGLAAVDGAIGHGANGHDANGIRAMDPRLARLTTRRLVEAAMVATLVFGVLGTVAALWENPFFIRMVPAGYGEIVLLAMLALLSGAYVAIRRPFCSNTTVGTGGVLGFLGIACPICNKILLLLFGGEFLLTYFEPLRIYVAAAGVLLAGWAVIGEWKRSADAGPMAR